MKKRNVIGIFLAVLALALVPGHLLAATADNYCIIPSFMKVIQPPNLLLMIDNSGSMYDLSYADDGYKTCSATTATHCTYDADCPTGETCSNFVRQPYYCFDETYKSSRVYAGYFDPAKIYRYRLSPNDDFVEVADAFPAGCPGSALNTAKTIPNTLCVEYSTSGVTKTLVSFVAKGNYLNWLSASKFDVEKDILTGGKYDGSHLIAESRGCVGRDFVKDANTGDFQNYASTSTNPNTALGITFTVHGPDNPYSLTAPSPGGQTYISIFGGKPFDYEACQDAVDAIATGNNADIKSTVASCLSSSVSGYCQQEPGRTCFASYPDCNPPYVASFCDKNPGLTCMTDASCVSAGTKGCSADATKTCTVDADCKVSASKVCDYDSALACTTDANCFVASAIKGYCQNKTNTKCSTDADCISGKSDNGPCVGEVSAGAHSCIEVAPAADYGTCIDYGSVDYGPCHPASGGAYVGPCVFGSQEATVKTKVSFQQSMQACWQLREGHPIGTDEVKTVQNQCSDIYGGYKTCDNDHSRVCSSSVDCASGADCVDGPPAIAPGSTALLCGSDYEGQFYEKNSKGAWVLKATATNDAIIAVHEQFCGDMLAPNVIDPTDAPSDTTVADNVPAILSGVGVEAQLGSAIGTMRVKLSQATAPTGLVQKFGNRIRMGLMTFNQFGSASETAILGTPMVCSNDATLACTRDVQCGTGNTCDATTSSTNLDGAKIIHEIGKGVCATMTVNACTVDGDCGSGKSCINKLCGTKNGTVCTTDANCSSGDVCASSGVGTYAGGLVQALNGIRAGSWTPFAEGFYNAIGYMAHTSSGESRTALRLNSDDFDEDLNPSQYRCQQNFTMLITDGSSTADRNTTVDDLAKLYASKAGKPVGWTTTCDNYAGSKNLPILSWIAKHEKMSQFSLASPATDAPNPLLLESRDVMTTFVVSTGASNGEEGDCNSINLLSQTAVNGGTTLRQAENPEELNAKIEAIFDEIERQSASGTAASILSNSQGSGANILQAVFHPRKKFAAGTESTWVGEIHNLWYYIDPLLGNSSIREDTDFANTSPNHVLNLQSDYVVSFFFDPVTSQTMVRRYRDADGDGSGETAIAGTMAPDQLSAIWRAGEILWQRNVSVSGQERNIKTSTGSSLMDFTTDNAAALTPYLQAGSLADAEKIINYVNGIDYLADTTMRPRTVTIGGSTGVWKLGDIVSSTPRLLSSGQLNLFDSVYGDGSYKSYVNSTNYKGRGMVFAGANDGMLHAFNLGNLSTTNNAALAAENISIRGPVKAALTGDDLGREEWAYIPKQALPYLTYLKDKSYEDKHIYFVDGPTVLFDASIGRSDDCTDQLYECVKPYSVVTAAGALDSTKNPWRTIMIGSMGIGGATRKSCDGVNSCVETPRTDPGDESKGLGYSSYFAMDITEPANPTLMWEFSNEALGFSTTGPAIIRIGPKDRNGKWFAVFGSGPTGPIDPENKQFLARSNQSLKLFVLDLKTGSLLRTIDASTTYNDLTMAFSGPLVGSQLDTDRWDPGSNGYYKDDALHFGYVKHDSSVDPPTWTQGGVMRLLTKESDNPDDWVLSKVIDDIGPVTTSVARLVERKNKRLWLYFGTGRYYHKLDDNDSRRAIFGVKEPCYAATNDIDPLCTTSLSLDNLTNQSADDAADNLGALADKGWFINLDEADATFAAERIVTDPVALTNGTVFFTSFKPTPDVCGYGGNSLVWVTKFDTGVTPPVRVMKGKILLQLSTGTFKEILVNEAFTAKGGRRTDDSLMTGKPPGDPPPVITNAGNKPVKKILHIQEK